MLRISGSMESDGLGIDAFPSFDQNVHLIEILEVCRRRERKVRKNSFNKVMIKTIRSDLCSESHKIVFQRRWPRIQRMFTGTISMVALEMFKGIEPVLRPFFGRKVAAEEVIEPLFQFSLESSQMPHLWS
jgi:hypothetical protein